VACELAQACVGLCEGVLGLSPRGSKTRTLLRLVSVWLTALLGFVFPLVPTACPFGQVPPPLRSLTSPHGDRPWGGWVPGGAGHDRRGESDPRPGAPGEPARAL